MSLNLKKKIPAKKALKALLPLTLFCFALLITAWAVKRKDSMDIQEKEILLIEPPSEETTTQTTHIKQMFRYNPQHTGISPYVGPTEEPKFEWKYKTGGYTWPSPAIGPDGTIYIGSWDKHLHAINPNGELKWKYKTGNYILSSPAIGPDGIIYIGSNDNHLYAINPNGKLIWKYKTGSSIYSSPAIAPDGTIYRI